MTVPIAFLLGLMAGSAIAWLARGPLSDIARPLRSRYGAVAMLFGVALMLGGLALFLQRPGWALMYVVHPQHAAVLVWPGVVLGLLAAPALGLRVGHLLLSDATTARWWAWIAGLMAAMLFCLFAGMDRLSTIAVYEVFHYGATTVDRQPLSLRASKIFGSVMAISTLVPMLFAYCLAQVQQHAALSADVPPNPFEDFPAEDEQAPA